MSTLRTSPFLRFALILDAIVSGASALLMVTMSSQLAGLLHLPAALLFYAGVFLVPYAGLLAYLSRRETLPRWTIWTLVVGNVMWAADCVLLALSDWVAPSVLGYVFIATQAIAVVAFAELQYVGMRRSAVAA